MFGIVLECLLQEIQDLLLHDYDIKTYDRRMLAKLFYPVVNLFNLNFVKLLPKVADNKMNGRVARLLVFPLLNALEKQLEIDYINLMKSFKYHTEFSFREYLPELRISSDWGIEIAILSKQKKFLHKIFVR